MKRKTGLLNSTCMYDSVGLTTFAPCNPDTTTTNFAQASPGVNCGDTPTPARGIGRRGGPGVSRPGSVTVPVVIADTPAWTPGMNEG